MKDRGQWTVKGSHPNGSSTLQLPLAVLLQLFILLLGCSNPGW